MGGDAVLYDGLSTFDRGVNSGRRPFLLGRDQVAYASNVSFRDGLPFTRPPLKKLDLTFPDDEAAEAAFETGRFQGVCPYESDGGNGYLVLMIDGRLYRANVGQGNNDVQDVSPEGEANPADKMIAWGTKGELWQVWQDGQSKPIIFNGAASRRAADNEIKTGCMGAYGHGRFWFANPDLRSFRGYDLVRGASGTQAYHRRDAVLKDSENTFLNEGGDFSTPGETGPINALRFVNVLDASTGQGPLQVLTSRSIFSVNCPTDKATWKDVTYPIQTTSLIDYGGLGQGSTITVNGDIFYRSLDGIRSFIIARRAFRSWGNTPISTEMKRTLRYDNPALMGFGSAVLFDNRMLMTVSPVLTDRGVYHRGMAVLDFDHVSAMGDTSPPQWEGAWKGHRFLAIAKVEINSDERCFAVVLGDDDAIEIWEWKKEGIHDSDGPISCAFETGALAFKNKDALKRLEQGLLSLIELQGGNIDFTVKWRPDQWAGWQLWKSWSECATTQDCADMCSMLRPLQPQFRPRISLGVPPDVCEETTQRNFRDFYEAQFRFEWTGKATIKDFGAEAKGRREATFGPDCPTDEPVCLTIEQCPEPDFE